MPSTIEAAGGVLWRPATGRFDTEVALVHRPEHRDWSLPKGKLLPGEHVVLGALREVAEETGLRSVVGVPLGSTRYVKDGTPKRVRYWALRAGPGWFVPSKEVDDVVWLPPDAAGRLARRRDRPIVEAYERLRAHRYWPLLLVRHGRAVPGHRWNGPNHDRPLDARGRQQAVALARLLDAYGVQRMIAADLRRCRETLQPRADHSAGVVETEPMLTKAAMNARRAAAVDRLLELARAEIPAVICAQQSVIRRLLDALAAELGGGRRSISARKSGFYAVHLHADGPARRWAVEQLATSA